MSVLAWPVGEPVIEPVPAETLFIDGIAAIEIEGGMVCAYLYANEITLETPHAGPHRVLKIKIRGQLANIPTIIGQLAQCLVAPAIPEPIKRVFGGPHLVT